jgi:pilus assembly protein Flp/PilA
LCIRGRATALEAHRKENRGSFEMRRIIAAFIKDQAGATAIEYGLIAAGISIAIIVAVNGIGVTLNGTFTNVNSQLR